MTVKEEFPPNYAEIAARFDLTGIQPVFAYGEVLYNPYSAHLDEHLLVHEEAHSKRQQGWVEEWWDMYLESDDFRLLEEVIAYRAQYDWYKSRYDKRSAGKLLIALATDLSSDMYGNICSFTDAIRYISNPQP